MLLDLHPGLMVWTIITFLVVLFILSRTVWKPLLGALDAIPWAPTCPHGRPVAIPFARAEIERRFGRR